MNKIGLIITREYLSRVRSRVFVILTLLGPILYSMIFIIPVLTTMMTGEKRTVEVVDDSGKFKNHLKNGESVDFNFINGSYSDEYTKMGKKNGPEYLLHIPAGFDIFKPNNIELITLKSTSATFNESIESCLNKRIEELKMQSFHLNKELIDSLKSNISIEAKVISEQGLKNSSSGAASAAAFVGGFLIYMFIFLYGSMVLRGVQEEKQSRVVEVIISSVKPFQLMLGKIIGIALVGLTQFTIWVVLTSGIYTFIKTTFLSSHTSASAVQSTSSEMISQFQGSFATLNLPLLIGMFIFYFLGGYLIYSSLFAGVAAATDSQSDSQQFTFPISLPIIISIMFLAPVINNPDSGLAVTLSMIPLTSPIIMMARLPFGVPAWQIALSMVFLIGGFLFTTWLAGRIYRTGILLYGKKTSFKEIFKWLFYKE